MRWKDLGIKLYREILRQKKEYGIYSKVCCTVTSTRFTVEAWYHRVHGYSGGYIEIIVWGDGSMLNASDEKFVELYTRYLDKAQSFYYNDSLYDDRIIREVMELCYRGYDKIVWRAGCLFSREQLVYKPWLVKQLVATTPNSGFEDFTKWIRGERETEEELPW